MIVHDQAPAVDLAEAQAYCQQLTRRTAKNFYYAFALLNEEGQKAGFAIYAFCREADDLADAEGVSDAERLAALDAYEKQLEATLRGESVPHPVFTAVRDVLARVAIPPEAFRLMIAGMRQDVRVHRYATFAELEDYCYQVASSVALLLMPIFDAERAAALGEYARTGGVAVQLTNILRDVREDAQMGRIYLPQEDLARFDLSEADIFAGVYDARFKALMAFETERARELYARADALLTPRDRKRQQALETARLIYRRLLDRIVARDYDVLRERIAISTVEKAWISVFCLLRGLVTR